MKTDAGCEKVLLLKEFQSLQPERVHPARNKRVRRLKIKSAGKTLC